MRQVLSVRSWCVLLALALLALFALGCSDEPHLAGTHDVEVIYGVEGKLPPKPGAKAPATAVEKSADAADNLAARVRERLAAGAHATADVDEPEPNRLRLVMDGDATDVADELLTWRGGVSLYAIDDAMKLDAKSSEAKDVLPAIAAAHPPPNRRWVPFLEPDGKTVRAVAIVEPAAADLSLGVESARPAHWGKDVALKLTPAGADAARAAASASHGAPLAVVRFKNAIAVDPIDVDGEREVFLHFGGHITAYQRASHVAALLSTPPLPPLARISRTPRPSRWGIAVLSVVLPIVISFVWLTFVRRFDRAHPEPMWLVAATFALGGLSVIPAALAEYGLMSASPYLDPSVMTLGGNPFALPIGLVVFTVVVGFSEEGSKFLGAWSLARHRREFDEPVDGIVYGVAASLGFAAIENVKYFAVGRLAGALVVMRTFTSVPGHMFFGAIWGYALGRKLVSKKTSVLLYFIGAAFMHGAFDTFLSVGLGILTIPLQLVLASLFLFLLRRALRHGVVQPGGRVPESSQRLTFVVGSTGTFALSAIALHVCAFAVIAVGIAFEVTHARVGYGFLCAATVSLMLLGISAYGISRSMPLDAVVDENGVTFGGTMRAWARITGFRRRRVHGMLGAAEELVLESPDGELKIGPGKPRTIEVLTHALARGNVPDATVKGS